MKLSARDFPRERSFYPPGTPSSEQRALDELVDQFAAAMKAKLRRAGVEKGRSGWDDPKWTPEEIKAALLAHVDKGDPVDVANFAAFWWNRQ